MNKKLRFVLLAAAGLAAIIGLLSAAVQMQAVFDEKIYSEKQSQLEELTGQLSSTLENAFRFNRACTNSAVQLFEQESIGTEEELIDELNLIDSSLDVGSNDAFFIALDSEGYCYDINGRNGIWGDFDQVANGDVYSTFISDSINYSDVYWAFSQKLDTPAEISSDGITITHLVLLKSVSVLEEHYISSAYEDVSETYVLYENGTRMYDNVSENDTLPVYNIYKYLRSCRSIHGVDFDELLTELGENGVICTDYEINGEEYYISIAQLPDYNVVLMYLIPADSVAYETLSMIYSMMNAVISIGLVAIVLTGIVIFTFLTMHSSRELYEQKEQNIRELEKINASLETAKLASEDALAIAEAANNAKSSFLSNMSHDIRTPLNAIIGFTTLLKKDLNDPERVAVHADKIESAGKLLLSLINDVLDMSRIESGKTTLASECVGMSELLNEISNVIAPQAKSKKQTFTVNNGCPADMTIKGDKLRLEQILINLLSNSVKYTADGGKITLDISAHIQQTSSIADMTFAVSDNGCGMSEEFLKKVFDPFEREYTGAASSVQGTGLGLAIAKNLAELMGGVITAESKRNVGSRFTVNIPMQLVRTSEQSENEYEKEENADSDILKGKHFLVAEDNEINAEIIEELLAMEGATCSIAENGERVVKAFSESAPGIYDAILMDIQMPVMDGLQAARAIRECGHEEAKTIPIAAMTANAFTEDVRNALEAGMNAHITKPVDMTKIKQFMLKASKRKK